MKRVGWTTNYRGMGRVPQSVNLYPFVRRPARQRPATNSVRAVRPLRKR